jgi:hypothetical protein
MLKRVISRLVAAGAVTIVVTAAFVGCNSDHSVVGIPLTSPASVTTFSSEMNHGELVARIRGTGVHHKPYPDLLSEVVKLTVTVRADVFADGTASGQAIIDGRGRNITPIHVVVDLNCGRVEGDTARVFGDIVKANEEWEHLSVALIQIVDGGAANDEMFVMATSQGECEDALSSSLSTVPTAGNFKIIWSDHPDSEEWSRPENNDRATRL